MERPAPHDQEALDSISPSSSSTAAAAAADSFETFEDKKTDKEDEEEEVGGGTRAEAQLLQPIAALALRPVRRAASGQAAASERQAEGREGEEEDRKKKEEEEREEKRIQEELFGDIENEVEEQGRREGVEVKDLKAEKKEVEEKKPEVEDVGGEVKEVEGRRFEEREVEEEEARAPKRARDPAQPTRAEWEAHQANHLPYRSWCRYCVEGRLSNPPHHQKAAGAEEPALPEVHMDYAFVRREGEADTTTILVVKHRQSRAIRCWVVPRKGRWEELAAELATDGLRGFGLPESQKIVLKTDGEEAIVALRGRVAALWPAGAQVQTSPPHEHEANGVIESGVRLGKGLLRVHLLALEGRLRGRLPCSHPAFAWLVSHSSAVLTKNLVGKDGRTPYYRLHGKEVTEESLEFGETLRWRPPRGDSYNVLLEPRWKLGVWLGRHWGGITHYVFDPEAKVVRDVRAVQRVPLDERWDLEAVQAVSAWPRLLQPRRPGEEEEAKIIPEDAPPEVPTPAVERRAPNPVYLKRADFEQYGFTAGCPCCRRLRGGLSVRGFKHTPACRARLEERLREADDVRMAAADRRMTERLVEVTGDLSEGGAEREGERGEGEEGVRREVVEEEGVEVRGGGGEGRSGDAARDRQSGSRLGPAASGSVPLPPSVGGTSAGPAGPADEDAPMDRGGDEEMPDQGAMELGCLGASGRAALSAAQPRSSPGPCGDREEATALSRAPCSRLMSLLRSMPGDLRGVVRDLLELYACNGVPDAKAEDAVAELFSVPRVTAELKRRRARCPGLGLVPGATFDLQQDEHGRAYDVLKREDRDRIRRRIARDKPFLVIGSPPCVDWTFFNETINHQKMTPEEVRRRKVEREIHLRFAVEIYCMQLAGGRHFVHEHPAAASSWNEEVIRDLAAQPGVGAVVAHLCQFGLVTPAAGGGQLPAKKATRFLSSSPEVLAQLGRRCRGEHVHQPLRQSRAAAAAIYPPALCRAFLRGAEAQRRREGRPLPAALEQLQEAGLGIFALRKGGKGEERKRRGKEEKRKGRAERKEEGGGEDLVVDEAALDHEVEDEEEALRTQRPMSDPVRGPARHAAARVYDEYTGDVLPPRLVRAAREEEVSVMEAPEWHVWDVVDEREALRVTGKKPLKGRWVDTNKGDRENPQIRSRWCAKEVATYKTDAFFASTPPLEAMRLIMSEAATTRSGRRGEELKLMLLDAKKAHLHAPAVRPVYVELPPERATPGKCCRLRRCLYGTRDAPQQWERFAARSLEALGFTRGRACATCFYHRDRQLRCLVHGDDFLFSGSDANLDWVKTKLAKDILFKDGGRLGGGANDQKEIRCLNRVLRWTPAGFELEADPRHAEILSSMLGEGATPVKTPGVKEKVVAPRGQTRPASEEDASEYAARVSARSAKVADLQVQIRELADKLRCSEAREEELRQAAARRRASPPPPSPGIKEVRVEARGGQEEDRSQEEASENARREPKTRATRQEDERRGTNIKSEGGDKEETRKPGQERRGEDATERGGEGKEVILKSSMQNVFHRRKMMI